MESLEDIIDYSLINGIDIRFKAPTIHAKNIRVEFSYFTPHDSEKNYHQQVAINKFDFGDRDYREIKASLLGFHKYVRGVDNAKT